MSDMINLIKQLRDRTGAGLMDCKKALLENNNNVDAACDWLREKGIAKQAKKASTRIAAEGIAWVLAEGNKAAIIEVNSETDFVANSDPFRALVKEVNSLVLANAPKTLDEAKELKNADGKSIADLFVDATVKLGEKLDFRRFEVVEKADDEVFGPYIHMNGKIATLVVLKGGNTEVANGVALNVCSNNPTYINETDIPADVIAKETKKPAAIQDKIIAGKVNKVLFDSVLVDEPFIFDDSKTVGQYLKENNASVIKTIRFAVGEGIEKRQDDFAAEVAAQASAGK